MAGKRGVLTVRVVSDTKGLERGMDLASKKVDSTGDRFISAGKKMTVFASVPIVAAMGAATNAASDLEQSIGGVESVFGDAKGPVEDFADAAADAAGLSKRQVNEMAAVIGASLKGLGFTVDEAATKVVDLEKRAADMAATFGGSTEEAIQAVAAALRGERDPIERYGVSIKEADVNARLLALGLDTSTTAAEKKSKAVATLDLLMGQTADTEGQFAREADGAAGSLQRAKAQMENAAAELGDSLLPIAAKAAGGVADLASKFGELPEPIQNSVIGLAGVIAVSGPLTTALGGAINAGKKLADVYESTALRAMYLKESIGGVGGLTPALVGVGALVGLGVALYQDYADAKAEARRVTDAYVQAMKDENGELDENLDKVTAQELANKDYASALRETEIGFNAFISGARDAGDEIDALDKNMLAVQTGGMTLEQALRDAGLGGTALGDALLEVSNEIGLLEMASLVDDLDKLATGQATATEKSKNEAAALEGVGEATDGAADAASDAIAPTDAHADAMGNAEDQAKDLEQSINEVSDALHASIDPLWAARDAFNDHADAQRGVTDAEKAVVEATARRNWMIGEHGKKSWEARNATDDLRDAELDLEEAHRRVGDAALDVTDAVADLSARMREGNVDIEAAEQQIKAWADQGLITANQAADLTKEIQIVAWNAGLLDGQQATVRLSLDASAFWENLAAARFALTESQLGAQAGGATTAGPQLRHTGGPVHAGTPYLVGRAGHEELFIPGQDGQIISGPKTDQILGGSGGKTVNVINNFTVNGNHDPKSIAQHVAWALV